MNRKGLHAFALVEAENFEAYSEWNYEELDLGTTLGDWVVAQYITTADAAKQVIIYPKPGITMDADEKLSFYINDTLTASGSLADEAMDAGTSEVEFDVDDGDHFSAGDVILVDAELMYVSSISTDTLTVIRAYGQTAGLAHLEDALIWKVGTPSNHTSSTSKTPVISLDTASLPFTISGVVIKNLYVLNSGAAGNTNDDVAVLSFH